MRYSKIFIGIIYKNYNRNVSEYISKYQKLSENPGSLIILHAMSPKATMWGRISCHRHSVVTLKEHMPFKWLLKCHSIFPFFTCFMFGIHAFTIKRETAFLWQNMFHVAPSQARPTANALWQGPDPAMVSSLKADVAALKRSKGLMPQEISLRLQDLFSKDTSSRVLWYCYLVFHNQIQVALERNWDTFILIVILLYYFPNFGNTQFLLADIGRYRYANPAVSYLKPVTNIV